MEWKVVLVGALALNGVIGFGYRVHRLAKGGPLGDVVGQAILGCLLGGIAIGAAAGAAWARWVALAYALVFGVVVMPVWVLAVLIPLRPGTVDYSFTAVYWCGLAVIAVSALAS